MTTLALDSDPVIWGTVRLTMNSTCHYDQRLANVDSQRVRAQPGGFYGGWITDEIVGPFKGEPGTGHW